MGQKRRGREEHDKPNKVWKHIRYKTGKRNQTGEIAYDNY